MGFDLLRQQLEQFRHYVIYINKNLLPYITREVRREGGGEGGKRRERQVEREAGGEGGRWRGMEVETDIILYVLTII